MRLTANKGERWTPEKLTQKLREALEEAIRSAKSARTSRLSRSIWFYALLRQDNEIFMAILDGLGIPTFTLIKAVEQSLKGLAKVSGHAQVYFSQSFNKLIKDAELEA